MKKILNKKLNKGITLIALVITIVVLLILTAIAINLTLGNNGIFQRAKTAKEEYQNAEEQEKYGLSAKIIDELIDAKLKKIDGVDSVTLAVDDTISSSKLKVTVTVQTSKEVNITSYEYFIYKGEQLVTKNTTAENNCTLEGLEAGEEYNIIVEIYNDQSNANKSDVVTYTKKALWDKYEYDAVGDYTYSCTDENVTLSALDRQWYNYGCTSLEECFDSNTGKWSSNKFISASDLDGWKQKAGEVYLHYGSNSYSPVSMPIAFVLKEWVEFTSPYGVTYIADLYRSSGTTTYTPKGDSLGVVSDTNPNKYPDDGYQDNYYYIKK